MTVAHRIRDRLATLVGLPSVSSTDPARDSSNRDITDCLANWFRDLGFEVERHAVAGGAKYNLIATCGKGENGLVLAGHTDTVPFDEGAWHSDPFTLNERDGRYYGLGAADMKCFFASVLGALEDVDPSRLRVPLTVVATADEETSMAGARELLAAHPALGRYGVIGEPTGLVPVAMHKGVAQLAVEVRGRAGHASDPALGNNAIDGMHAVLAGLRRWREELADTHAHPGFQVPGPTLNFGAIHGGDNANRICARCTLLVDLRFLPGMDLPAVVGDLRATVAAALAGSGLEHTVRELMSPVPPYAAPADSGIVRYAEEITGVPAGAVAFATEAPFLAGLGVETVILGPGAIAQAHQPDEYCAIDPLLRMVKINRRFIQRFCGA